MADNDGAEMVQNRQPQPKSKPEVVVITGASAGVGRAVTRKFARPGVAIGLLARGSDRLEAAKKEVEEAGGEALAIPTDVAEPNQVQAAAQLVEEQFGPIDIWINNAMTSVFSPARQMTPEEYKRVTEVTYLGVVYGTLSALRSMLPRDQGCVVQVGSALAYRSIPLQSAYCAAKHAVRGFTDSIRSELIHDGSNVQITMVQLPALNTPQFEWVKSRLPRKAQPVPPIFQPEVAADAIYHAAYHPRREFFVGISTVKAILGNKLVPGWLDHYLADAAYQGQQMDELEDPNRPHNLWAPVSGDYAAQGKFHEVASDFSLQVEASLRRKKLGWLAGLSAGLLAAVFLASQRSWGGAKG
jgi:short-subunit dehydrogenase